MLLDSEGMKDKFVPKRGFGRDESGISDGP
jgi:hypothetical protein